MSVDRSSTDKKFKYSYSVTKEKISEFVEAISDNNPLYIDEKYGKRTSFGGIVAPPTFVTTCSFCTLPETPQLKELRSEHALLHVEQEYEYFHSIKPGDTLTFRTKVVETYTKKGRTGILDFIVKETVFENQLGEKVVIGRSTTITRR